MYMLLCPIQNTAVFNLNWTQKRPRVTQWFRENPAMYKPMGMKAHNGIDFGIPTGTPIFAPMDGEVVCKKSKSGYGWHIKIRNPYKGCEVVLGHLSNFYVKTGDRVNTLQKIGLSGNTGFSTAPHLHVGLRFLEYDKGHVNKWKVKDYNNGYFGYIDFEMGTWKGSTVTNNL